MATATPSPPQPPAPDAFASLLAALAAPAHDEGPGPLLDTKGGGLKEDVVAFSYEHTPRARESRELEMNDIPASQERNDRERKKQEKKSASITIRMSADECDRLKQRAAEAGLTLSAYLRSCTLEAESLRAQVKEALAAIRTAAAQPAQSSSIESAEPTRRWWNFSRPAQA